MFAGSANRATIKSYRLHSPEKKTAGVSIINYFDILKSTVLQLLVICVVSTIVTFAVTAYVVTLTVKLMEKKKGGKKA